jgi:hypothetical protein
MSRLPVVALLVSSLTVSPLAAVQGPGGGRPPAMPPGARAVLMRPIATSESTVRARLDAIVKDRTKSNEAEQKRPRRLYERLPKPPSGRALSVHLDPGWKPVLATQADIDAWQGVLGREWQLLNLVSDSGSQIWQIATTVVQQATNNAPLLVTAYDQARAAAAKAAAVEQLSKSKQQVTLLKLSAEAAAGRFDAVRRLQETQQLVLDALEQGGPADYRPRYAAWIESGRQAAREREQQSRDAEQTFAALMAGFIFGVPLAAVASANVAAEARTARKFADPNYDVIMQQTRQAYRDACESEGGVFKDGTGDDPGTCMSR